MISNKNLTLYLQLFLLAFTSECVYVIARELIALNKTLEAELALNQASYDVVLENVYKPATNEWGDVIDIKKGASRDDILAPTPDR